MSIFKIKPLALFVILVLTLGVWSVSVKADGLTIGVKGAGNLLYTEAYETNEDGAETDKGDRTEEALIPSIFLEYNFGEMGNIGDSWIVGVDYIPLKPEIADENRVTSDITAEHDNTTNNNSNTVTQKAKADLKFHTTLYVETPGFWGGFYGKAGGIMTLLQTEENLGSGSTYPNQTILGAVAGIGFKRYLGNLVTKLEASYTAYETININARTAGEASGVTQGANKITADPEAYALSFSLGYAF